MSPAILHSIHIDHTNKYVITQELSNYCRKKSLHVIFGATNLDIEKADAYILSPTCSKVVPVSIKKRRSNQIVIESVDDIPKVVRSISRAFKNHFLLK